MRREELLLFHGCLFGIKCGLEFFIMCWIKSHRLIYIIMILTIPILCDDEFSAYDEPSGPSCSNRISNHSFSTAEECLRTCNENDEPLYCHYRFTLEYYTTMNEACQYCRPSNTNQLRNAGECECVEGDGVERTVFSVNRMIPGPSIQVCKNDMVIVDVLNKISGISVSLHWHGITQNGYQYYDGVPYVTQCPISGNNVFRYQFRAKNAGTHMWHSHMAVHKIDGQYGSLIVRQPPNLDPVKSLYDEDLPTHVLLLSDWMHELSMERFPGLLKRFPGNTAENILINGRGTWQDPYSNVTTNGSIEVLDVEPGKRYRIRMINAFSTICPSQLNIEDHRFVIISQDGNDVDPVVVDTIVTASGERVDFVIRADQPANRSYWIQVRGLGLCGKDLMIQQLGILRYPEVGSPLPPTQPPTYWRGLRRGILYNPLNVDCDSGSSVCANTFKSLEPLGDDIMRVEPDYRFVMPFDFYVYKASSDDFFRAGNYRSFMTSTSGSLVISTVDNIVYEDAPAPLISQRGLGHIECNRTTDDPEDSVLPTGCVHTLNIEKGSVVEIVIYDRGVQALMAHPFHLHGYAFRLFDIGRFSNNTNVTSFDIPAIVKKHKDRLSEGTYERIPKKDTVIVPQSGWIIFRIKADNPGWWLCHCHFVWHSTVGMQFLLHVGEQSDLPPIPEGFPTCGHFIPPVCPND